jgi:hypothetical protein
VSRPFRFGVVVFDTAIDDMTPVVARLAGR